MPPHLDDPFAVPCEEDPVVLVSGHGAHGIIATTLLKVHRELPQQTSIPVNGPRVDEAVDAAAQHGGRVRHARPGLQKDYLQEKG